MASHAPVLLTNQVEILRAVPCAEVPDLLQLEGRLFDVDRTALLERLEQAGWRVLQLPGQTSIIARLATGSLFLLSAQDEFSLSRIATVEVGIAQIRQMIDQTWSDNGE